MIQSNILHQTLQVRRPQWLPSSQKRVNYHLVWSSSKTSTVSSTIRIGLSSWTNWTVSKVTMDYLSSVPPTISTDWIQAFQHDLVVLIGNSKTQFQPACCLSTTNFYFPTVCLTIQTRRSERCMLSIGRKNWWRIRMSLTRTRLWKKLQSLLRNLASPI